MRYNQIIKWLAKRITQVIHKSVLTTDDIVNKSICIITNIWYYQISRAFQTSSDSWMLKFLIEKSFFESKNIITEFHFDSTFPYEIREKHLNQIILRLKRAFFHSKKDGMIDDFILRYKDDGITYDIVIDEIIIRLKLTGYINKDTEDGIEYTSTITIL